MAPYLACNDVSVRFYGAPSLTLRNVTISVQKGEKVLLLGPSGCGKSTLLSVLSGIIPGTIEAEVTGDIIRPASVGVMFQDPDAQFCMLTVGDEIAFSLENRAIPRNEMDARIDAAMRQANLFVPKDTLIETLSGGMKQRLALACLLALEADVLFLDEPTAQLDPQGRQDVFYLLKSIAASDMTMVFVEHVLDGLIDWMDRVILLDATGNLIGEGAPQDVLRRYSKEIEAAGIWRPRLFPHTMDEVSADSSHTLQITWRDSLKQSEKRAQTPRQEKPDICNVRDLTISYGKTNVLEQISFDIKKGEWIAIVGENGAGKSTLLKALAGLEKGRRGDIYIQDRPIRKWPATKLYEQVGFVFQNPELQFVTDRVYDEVAFGGRIRKFDESVLSEKTHRLLQEFSLDAHRDAHPFTLSQGQKRRLSVATMLLFEQKLLLLDEPTFGQDEATSNQLLARLMQRKKQGTAIVMVTHDMDIVDQYADRVLWVSDGTIRFDGAPYHLFSSEEEIPGLIRPLSYEWERRMRNERYQHPIGTR
ncbi:ABC transporter ATP-binding protein [Aneurinibacillus migulanus]|uniref:ABC transporter n=1 Tax=Aneurinibacillus migulanus TaxID=47500 RepID=A0A0D1VKV0_ANEMI|nr:ABC transporter ATP-binding protein [Aneurinibacillus migulanus]KIV60174.1 ABC transporter [Aneurinibacillus migulanus]KON97232.1 ABC transporter [Aneurinibacillus migulanus]MED0895895.1 ABC transporter ATP-binding protein [Aneurinibacillus migulanus]MED1618817.1 ABC transporter ATP-binding protein [Aneurinibacillus migulanus]SDJ53348.1 energy-coupling factor transport system ATP-binding protein [Aneurinibacillus migulanus]